MYGTICTSSNVQILSWILLWLGTRLLVCVSYHWQFCTEGPVEFWNALIQETRIEGDRASKLRCWYSCIGLLCTRQLFIESSPVSVSDPSGVGSRQTSSIPSLSGPCWSRCWLWCPHYKTWGCVLRTRACCWLPWRFCLCVSSKIELSGGQHPGT